MIFDDNVKIIKLSILLTIFNLIMLIISIIK